MGNESKSTNITKLEFEDTININPIDISNALNVLFFKMGPSLASEIRDTSTHFTDYVTPTEHTSI